MTCEDTADAKDAAIFFYDISRPRSVTTSTMSHPRCRMIVRLENANRGVGLRSGHSRHSDPGYRLIFAAIRNRLKVVSDSRRSSR